MKYIYNRCDSCRMFFEFDRIKKLRKKNICLQCHIENEKPYELIYFGSFDNPCGGSSIYKVIPKKSYGDGSRSPTKSQTLRLHNIAHYEMVLPGIRDMTHFQPVHSWNDIWNKMDNWMDPRWISKFKGKLKKGIYEYSGNGIIAFVQDAKSDIYFVNGVWG